MSGSPPEKMDVHCNAATPSAWLGTRTEPNRMNSPITMLPPMRNGAKNGMLTCAAAMTVSLFSRSR